MGILRSDRVSGLGGANAINGSVFFKSQSSGNGTYLKFMDVDDDFDFGTDDYTIEWWMKVPCIDTSNLGVNADLAAIADNGYGNTSNSTGGHWAIHHKDATITFGWNNANQITSSNFLTADTWHHVALVKSSGTVKIYGDGTQVASVSSTYDISDALIREFTLGSQIGTNRNFEGYISNFRIVNGTALYTAAFTPPTTRLDKTSDTVLLCCQSPGDATQEATGKVFTSVAPANSAHPQASHIAPDVGEDYGTTFADNTKFDTLSYMVPSGGTTAESNRGLGVFGGYYAATSNQTLDYISIQSMGNAVSFGELVQRASSAGCFASSTRGIWCGGYSAPDGALTDTIQYVTIATQSNAIDFGNLTVGGRKLVAGLSNNTRGINVGGHDAPTDTATNIIDYVTIATTGNATNFGDLTANALYCAAAGNTTRGIVYLGAPANPTSSNVINYITIASAGNATDFGDATQAVQFKGALAFSNSTRVVAAGGYDAPTNFNVIDYVTIATTGDATDFGDLTVESHGGASMTNSIRGVIAGTYHDAPAPYTNSMEYITIATLGNGADFGDNTVSDTGYCSGCSDSHGGIS